MSSLRLIQSRRAEIAKTRLALDDEERELVVAERVLQRLANGSAGAPAPRELKGQAALVLTALGEGTLWKSQAEIQAHVSLLHHVDLKPTSLQPLMSKLKAKGDVMKGDAGYALRARVLADAAPATVVAETAPAPADLIDDLRF